MVSSVVFVPTVVSEIVPLAFLAYDFYLSNSKWPQNYSEVESFILKKAKRVISEIDSLMPSVSDDSLRLLANQMSSKYKSVHFMSDTTRILNIQFELNPISNDSLKIQKTLGSIAIKPPTLTRSDTLYVKFDSLTVEGIEKRHHEKWIKLNSNQVKMKMDRWLPCIPNQSDQEK